MADKKTYYKLDDMGFVGTQEKKSAISRNADARKTAEIIRANKNTNESSISKSLDKFSGKVLFPEKLRMANKIIGKLKMS